MKIIIAAALIAGLPTGIAAQDRQFDLVCEGTFFESRAEEVEARSYGMRVDLDAMRWCWQDCDRTYDIVDVAPERIVLEFREEDTRSVFRRTESAIDRRTGAHESRTTQTRPVARQSILKGSCTPAPFSGFPQTLF